MDERTYIGIDNGVSGSIGIINGQRELMLPMPTRKELSYTKAKRYITRIDWDRLLAILLKFKGAKVFLERPMVNPGRFQATISAIRALEATLLAVESCHLSLTYVDSKQWQKIMLPSGIEGSAELKKASMDIGCRLFPSLAEVIRKHKDADGLLMAEWAARRDRL